jgi:hypothetical protein
LNIEFSDEEHASMTAGVRRAIAEDRYPHLPRLDFAAVARSLGVGGSDGTIGPASGEQIRCETRNN